MWRKAICTLGATLFATLLAACGGGGEDPVTVVETFAARTAWVNQFTAVRSVPFVISGTIMGVSVSGSGTLTEGPALPSSFEGVPGYQKTSTVTGTLTMVIGGMVITEALDDTSTRYVDLNYLPTGVIDSFSYQVVTSFTPLPLSVRRGDTGHVWTASVYDSAGKNFFDGTNTVTYSIQSDSATTALFTLTVTEVDPGGSWTGTSTLRFRMTEVGAITLISESYTDADGTLTVTYQN